MSFERGNTGSREEKLYDSALASYSVLREMLGKFRCLTDLSSRLQTACMCDELQTAMAFDWLASASMSDPHLLADLTP